MSFTTTMPAPQASGASAASGLRWMLDATAKGFRPWSAALERRRTQRLLASLDDRTLRDIGLARRTSCAGPTRSGPGHKA